uniref:Uncharacterized protein n=1 Tax=Ananas comosus var. bracteatus TaxID=296719 RepID=A0A6V7QHT2_ANACO|nr:unnamed protein product [Ananas comosus var. bracteatus]
MYNNFKEQFKGKVLKDLLWEAATLYTVQDWEKSMQKMKDANVATYDWLMKVPQKMWTRSYFSPDIKCDMLCNNMCKAWNRAILDARELPIIDLLEKIRRQIMTRFQEKRQYMERQPGFLCPKVQAKLEEIKKKG